MGSISAYSGQQSVAPLTRLLREQDRPDVGLANRDTSNERIERAQQTNARVTSTKGSENRNLMLQSGTASDSKPSANSPRGSLIDMTV